MRSRRRFAVLAVTAALLAPSSVLANPLDGVVAPPDVVVAPATDSETQRFVTLWSGRFRDPGFQAYVDSDVVYDDGYNDDPPEEQHRLVQALFDHLAAQADPAEVAAAEADPDQMHRADVVAMLEMLIFHKQQFKESLRVTEDDGVPEAANRAATDSPPAAAATPEVPAIGGAEHTQEKLDAALADTAALLERALAGEVDAIDRVEVPNPGTVTVPAPGPLPLPDGAPGDLTPVVKLSETFAAIRALADTAVTRVAAPTSIRSADFTTDPPNMFRGCYQRLGAPAPTCGLPQLYAVPALFNVDGNLLTGLGGFDLKITVVPATTGTTFGLAVTVEHLGTAAADTLGVAMLRIGTTNTVVTAGFDGRSAPLQPTQAVTVQVPVTIGGGGPTSVDGSVTHSGPAGTNLRVVADVVDDATGPIATAGLTILRAPSPLSFHYEGTSGSPQTARVTLSHNVASTSAGVLPGLDGAFRVRHGNRLTEGTLGVVGLPPTFAVDYERRDSGAMKLRTSASQTTDEIWTRARSGEVASAVRDTFGIRLRSVPTAVEVRVDDFVEQIAEIAHVGSTTRAAGVSRIAQPTLAAAGVTPPRKSVFYSANTAVASSSVPVLEVDASRQVGSVDEYLATGSTWSLPRQWRVSMPNEDYRTLTSAASATFPRIELGYKMRGVDARATVRDVPANLNLGLPMADDPSVSWGASSATTNLNATATIGATRGHVDVTTIPSSWNVDLDRGTLFSAASDVGLVYAEVSNTGLLPAALSASNYVNAELRTLSQPRYSPDETGPITDDVMARLRIQNARTVTFARSGNDTTFDFRLGGGQPFQVRYRNRDDANARRQEVDGTISPMPLRVNGVMGATNEVWSTGPTSVQMLVGDGDNAALDATPSYLALHGAWYRDGAANGRTAYRAWVHLTGLPTHAKFGADSVAIDGFTPTVPTLTLDYQRDSDPTKPLLEVVASLNGVGGSGPLNLTYRKVGTTTTATLAAGVTLGSLTASYRTTDMKVLLSTTPLPGQVTYKMIEEAGRYVVDYTANLPVDRITTSVQVRQAGATSYTARGSIELRDLPNRILLTVGNDPSGAGVVLSYDTQTASPARRLSIHANADGSMIASGAKVRGRFSIDVVQLPAAFTVSRSGGNTTFNATGGSLPRLDAWVSAEVNYRSWEPNQPKHIAGWLYVGYGVDVKVDSVVDNLRLTLTNVQSLTLRPTLISEISGNYGSLYLAWDRFQTSGYVALSVYARIDWPWWLDKLPKIPDYTDITIAGVTIPIPQTNTLRFHTFEPTWQNVVDQWFFGYRIVVDTRPKHVGWGWGLAGLGGYTIGNGTQTWRSNLVMPDPFGMSSTVARLVAGIVLHRADFVRGSVT